MGRACPNSEYLRFSAEVRQRDGVLPDHDSAYDYDVASMLLQCYRNARPGYDIHSEIVECLRAPFQFDGVTGHYDFEGRSHPFRPQLVYRITENGLMSLSGCRE